MAAFRMSHDLCIMTLDLMRMAVSKKKSQRTRGQADDLERCPSVSDTKGLSKYPLGCAMDRLSLRHLSSLLHYIVAHARLCALMAVSRADSVGLIAQDPCAHRLFSNLKGAKSFSPRDYSFLPLFDIIPILAS